MRAVGCKHMFLMLFIAVHSRCSGFHNLQNTWKLHLNNEKISLQQLSPVRKQTFRPDMTFTLSCSQAVQADEVHNFQGSITTEEILC